MAEARHGVVRRYDVSFPGNASRLVMCFDVTMRRGGSCVSRCAIRTGACC